jgi:methylaspartate ammonia-lyase
MVIKKAMYDTALAEFEAQRDKAIATARIYLEHPVGIGEHPQVIDEFIKQVKIAAEAEEAASMLVDTFRDELTQED